MARAHRVSTSVLQSLTSSGFILRPHRMRKSLLRSLIGPVLAIVILVPSAACAEGATPATAPAKDERVSDSAYSVQIQLEGKIESFEVYQSLNEHQRFYVAPQLRFLSADDSAQSPCWVHPMKCQQ